MSEVSKLDAGAVGLDHDVFMRTLIRELATSLESVVGLEEASGYISLVGQSVGEQIESSYKRALAVDRLSREQVADVLVDLKQRIRGDFYLIEQDDEKIVLGSRSCPFAEKVLGRDSMCMMTSNMFGTIAARNLGYSRIELQETIARGNDRCRVTVHLKPSTGPDEVDGREYFSDAVLRGGGLLAGGEEPAAPAQPEAASEQATEQAGAAAPGAGAAEPATAAARTAPENTDAPADGRASG